MAQTPQVPADDAEVGFRVEELFQATEVIQSGLERYNSFCKPGDALHIGDAETSGRRWRYRLERLPVEDTQE